MIIKVIQHHSQGHFFGENDSQNRGSHYNGPKENSHYDY
ncbi:HNH/endonuclease VII fold putative polymorphic toxin [Fluviispira multicolorata]|uniref:HNH/Endo VII superfamily nuclease toxins domain-containing protein n=1 Tax=Fluviispira multicolorata TaxID=2654512 RepID=A0A833N1D7_9BACT|nr:hypothetical protein GCL57_07140 [Fluviispira multicolorata]KAB8030742.1 hypothetical protein GCL57_07150 [Fluviispira multicolorata]